MPANTGSHGPQSRASGLLCQQGSREGPLLFPASGAGYTTPVKIAFCLQWVALCTIKRAEMQWHKGRNRPTSPGITLGGWDATISRGTHSSPQIFGDAAKPPRVPRWQTQILYDGNADSSGNTALNDHVAVPSAQRGRIPLCVLPHSFGSADSKHAQAPPARPEQPHTPRLVCKIWTNSS